MIRLLLTALLLVLLGTSAIHAQRRDLKLSPPEPVSWALPDSIRIHSADRIGDLALVVWGSNRRLADSTPVNVLWGQLVRNGVPRGAPFLVHGDEARPAHVVSVEALGDRFAVAWNDYSTGTGQFVLSIVATNGAVGPATMLSDSLPIGGRVYWFGDGSNGRMLLWTSKRGASWVTRARRISPEGGAAAASTVIGGAVTHVRPITAGLGGTVVTLDGNIRWAVRNDPLRLDRIGASIRDPFIVLPNGRVVMIDVKTVREHVSLFDTTIVRQRTLSMIGTDSLLVPAPGLRGDTLVLFGLRRHRTPNRAVQELVRVSLTRDLTVGATAVLYSDDFEIYYSSANEKQSVYPGRVSRSTGCESSFHMFAETAVHVTRSGYDDEATYRQQFSVVGDAFYPGSDTALADCRRDARLVIERAAIDTVSRMYVLFDETQSVLAATTTWRQVNHAQRLPGLDLTNEFLIVAYRQMEGDHPFVARTWFDRSDTATTLLDRLVPPRLDHAENPPWRVQTSYSSQEGLASSSGGVIVSSVHFRTDRVAIGTRGGDYMDKSGARYMCFSLGPSGWRQELILTNGVRDSDRWDLYTHVPTHIPESRVTAGGAFLQVAFGFPPYTHLLFTLDGLGKKVHEVRVAEKTEIGAIVLGTPGTYLQCVSGGVRAVSKDTTRWVLSFDDKVANATFLRLRGTSYLRFWRDSSVAHLERYSIEDGLIARTTADLATAQGDLAVAESPDGRLFLVHADAGIRIHQFDRRLNPQTIALHVSDRMSIARSPSAVVLHDSLVVVWEDYRNGSADIYGTAIALADIPARALPEAPSAESIAGVTIAPQPASDGLTITLGGPAREPVIVELVDMSGRRRSATTIAADRMQSSIALGDCTPGVYILRLRSGDRVEHRRVVVAR